MPRSLRHLIHLVIALVILGAITSCGTRSGRSEFRGSIAENERYDGPVALAIAPVVDGRGAGESEISLWWIQRVMSQELDRMPLYAVVIPLETRTEAHEGELLMQPALTSLKWTQPPGPGSEISMRIRVTHPGTGQVRLDRVYRGDCRHCRFESGQPPIAGPLTALMADLNKDLQRDAAR
ncbi:hypothetical protein CKO25_08780 [Thiocapsa imhoffii]|uniref:Lipoprotein n=1 Tax=Thiocapsa imhoffii TaxID=382777 RepID=A0A9X0WHS7_9GAMM|nr:hypothetical protein [Thiocapsa imhoffii]MBK1644740.1 hypothetical protein [Thiocapsa imhoffii]